MEETRIFAPLLTLGALALPARTAPAAQVAPPPAAPAAIARVRPTFESLHVAADELPEGWRLEQELACVSPQTATLLEGDIYSQILPKAKRQDFQTVAGPKAKGSLLYFDWGERIPDAVGQFVPALLFGDERAATDEHPEQIVRIGGVMVIVSFPPACVEREFVIGRLRTRFGLRTPFVPAALKEALETLTRAVAKGGDRKAGLAYATAHATEFAGSSLAAFLEGELATATGQWERAEKSYARAVALDAATDPLDGDERAYAAHDRRGGALFALKRYDDALRELETAAAAAASLRLPKDQAHSLYNAACCLALLSRGDDAVTSLKQSLALDSSRKRNAAADSDLASLRTRPDFQALVR